MGGITAVIPARYGSSRLPGKALLEINGKPMVQWVWEAAKSTGAIDNVIIATDDERIDKECSNFGANTVLTSSEISTGTDRTAKVIMDMYPSDRPEMVINIQADEPLITCDIIDRLLDQAIENKSPLTTIITRAENDDISNASCVKVVIDLNGNALFFSRSPIPFVVPTVKEHGRNKNKLLRSHPYKHIGVYVFQTGALMDFAQLVHTPLEQTEKLEQLRALEHGWRIKCVEIPEASKLIGVDTEEDLARAREALMSKGG